MPNPGEYDLHASYPAMKKRSLRSRFVNWLLTPERFLAICSLAILGVIVAGVHDCITTNRGRGGLRCNEWIAQCVMRNDLPTCLVKAESLGCPAERVP